MTLAEQSPEAIERGVVAYLRDEFTIDEADLGRDTKLVSGGLLDSVSLVQVATWAERTFGVEIPDEDIDAENLDSVGMIVDYICRKLSAGS